MLDHTCSRTIVEYHTEHHTEHHSTPAAPDHALIDSRLMKVAPAVDSIHTG